MEKTKNNRSRKHGEKNMICNLSMKSGKQIMIQTDYDLKELNQAKNDCIKSLIFDEVEIINNHYELIGEIIVDVYSIEIVKEMKNLKGGAN